MQDATIMTQESSLASTENPQNLLAQLRLLTSKRTLSHAERLNLRILEADEGLLFQPSPVRNSDRSVRVAVLSMLFNWPSTGGGIVHTAELTTFLTTAGFDVCHFYAVFEPWGVGSVASALPYKSRAIAFDPQSWSIDYVAKTFRQEVDRFAPDCVIITDSWNSKPRLANAMAGYPYFLRLAALECLCPLNNVRLLIEQDGRPKQCHKTQLATPDVCRHCVSLNEQSSGSLHRDERAFSEFHTSGYADELHAAFENAAGVFAVNPLIASLCEPYCQAVHVIPSGFDPKRFEGLSDFPPVRPFRLLFAGLVNEYMKGFHILLEACWLLWNRRQDFELHVTADAHEHLQNNVPFISFRGWQTQDSLPSAMAECHAIIVPTVAQEALGRTAVEAMGAARPVIASRIGGLAFTVVDGFTGLLVEPAKRD